MAEVKFPKIIMVWEETDERTPEEKWFNVARRDSDLPLEKILVATYELKEVHIQKVKRDFEPFAVHPK